MLALVLNDVKADDVLTDGGGRKAEEAAGQVVQYGLVGAIPFTAIIALQRSAAPV